MAREVSLTSKQYAVVRELVSNGPSNREIADRLGLSEDTVKCHIKVALDRSRCATRTELAVKYLRGMVRFV